MLCAHKLELVIGRAEGQYRQKTVDIRDTEMKRTLDSGPDILEEGRRGKSITGPKSP